MHHSVCEKPGHDVRTRISFSIRVIQCLFGIDRPMTERWSQSAVIAVKMPFGFMQKELFCNIISLLYKTDIFPVFDIVTK